MVINTDLIGQKAKNLVILSERFPTLIPRFEVIEVSRFITNWIELNNELDKLATDFLKGRLSEDQYESELAHLFDSLEINKDFINQLAKKVRDLGFRKVSYRTSALQEDLHSSSFAGQYVTFLDKDIEVETIEKCSKACAKSMYSPRVLGYIKTQGYSDFDQGGSIIIQKMFYGKASGVLFTENGFNQIEFAYTYSWKNTTVEGNITNNFTVSKSSKCIIEEIPDKFPKTILTIIETAIILERQEGKPLDIEWAITEDKAAILQFRPITTPKLDYTFEWDNTNIAESYPGITLPLTYTFIRRLYSKVYPEFLKLLGKSDTELSNKTDIFNNMLGYMYGRVYYNINNWYKLIALLPGFKYNKDFFEAMLMPAKKGLTQKATKKKTSLNSKVNLGITALRFIRLLLQTNKLSDNFTKRYLSRYEIYKSVLWNQLNAVEIINTYNKIEKDLLEQWAIPILNDFRTMVFHGILRKVFFPKNNDDLYVQLLSGIFDHTSVEPIRELCVLAFYVKRILDNYKGDQEKTTKVILSEEQYNSILNQIQKYLSKYGGRSPDELKLENPRLSESLPTFVSFIVSSADGYSNSNNITKKINKGIEGKVSFGNSFFKRLILKPFFKFVLYQAKSGISKRERFRFYRAQVFGLARGAYLELGNRFVDANLIESRDDIFYLTINEIQDIILGHSFDYSFKTKINDRKKLFLNFAKQNMGRRIISSGLVAPLNTITDGSVNKLAKDKLTGLGVSKGVFQGKVVIVKEFDPKANVKGKVLVTEHTDPGWTLLFLNASALIVERGNALSHASIVSREIGIPAVVAVEDACNKLKSNEEVIVNGSTGEITIL